MLRSEKRRERTPKPAEARRRVCGWTLLFHLMLQPMPVSKHPHHPTNPARQC